MNDIQYYCLDLETNGLGIDFHEITELSIIRTLDKCQLSRNVKADHPENSSIDALKITGKTIQDLMHGISKHQLISEVEEFINQDGLTPKHRCLVGHNIINFDKKFLHALWGKHNKYFPIDMYLDTMHLFRAYLKKNGHEKVKVNLANSCDFLGIKKIAGVHNAVSDVRNTYYLWKKLMEEIDYLPMIKSFPHKPAEENDEDEFNLGADIDV